MGIFVEKVQEYLSPSQWSTQIPGLVSEPGVVNEEPVLIVEAGVVFG